MGTTTFSAVLSRWSVQEGEKEQRQYPPAELHPPRYQPGVVAPFVFGAELPWGWLEYRSGNFQGQRLALKRAIITLGRGEDCDIWLDDDLASRRHAELAWQDNMVYLTDCQSLNSTHLNGRQVRGSVLLSSEDMIEIGTHRFLFILASPHTGTTDQYDPLVNHKWHSSFELQESRQTTRYSLPLPAAPPAAPTDQVSRERQDVEPDRAVSDSQRVPDRPLSNNGPLPLRLPSRPKES
jgi:hypothetical protein